MRVLKILFPITVTTIVAIIVPDAVSLVGMLMLAAVFMLQNTLRGSAIMWRVVLSIAAGFTFYFASQVVFAFGLNGYIPVWLAATAPTLIIILVSTSLLIQSDEV